MTRLVLASAALATTVTLVPAAADLYAQRAYRDRLVAAQAESDARHATVARLTARLIAGEVTLAAVADQLMSLDRARGPHLPSLYPFEAAAGRVTFARIAIERVHGELHEDEARQAEVVARLDAELAGLTGTPRAE